MKLHNVEINQAFDTKMILIIIFGTLLTFVIGYIAAKYAKLEPANEGVFVQGAFRSNYAIVSMAIIIRMFGTDVAAKAAFLLLFALPLFNLLSVIALAMPFAKSDKLPARQIISEIAKNPLIIAVAISIIYSVLDIGLHSTIATTGNYLADTALPIALIGIGGSLNIKSLKQASNAAVGSSLIKIVFSPVVVVTIAWLMGIHGSDLGIIFLVFASPTAIASFVMTAGMKGNIKLAGNIIIVSTLGSIVTIILGLFILTFLDLI